MTRLTDLQAMKTLPLLIELFLSFVFLLAKRSGRAALHNERNRVSSRPTGNYPISRLAFKRVAIRLYTLALKTSPTCVPDTSKLVSESSVTQTLQSTTPSL